MRFNLAKKSTLTSVDHLISRLWAEFWIHGFKNQPITIRIGIGRPGSADSWKYCINFALDWPIQSDPIRIGSSHGRSWLRFCSFEPWFWLFEAALLVSTLQLLLNLVYMLSYLLCLFLQVWCASFCHSKCFCIFSWSSPWSFCCSLC